MQLVDKQDDAPIALTDLVQNSLEPLLKLAAILRACDQSTHIKGEDGLILQARRHVALDDALGKPLGDSSLANAGLADQHRIVLALTAQDADHVSDLVVTADDRIELIRLCPLYEVGTVFLKRSVGLLGVVARHPLIAAHSSQPLHSGFLGYVIDAEQLFEGLIRLIEQTEEEVLDRDILVFHRQSDLLSAAERIVHILRYIDFPCLTPIAGHLRQLVDLSLDGGFKAAGIDAHSCQKLWDESLRVADQRIEQMYLFHSLITVLLRDILRGLHSGE